MIVDNCNYSSSFTMEENCEYMTTMESCNGGSSGYYFESVHCQNSDGSWTITSREVVWG